MTERTYPLLPQETQRRLEAIKMLSKSDEEYFEDERCPYPWLKPYVTGQAVITKRVVEEKSANPIDDMMADLRDMINSMTAFETEVANSETGERIQFIKAKTQLIEKWTDLQGRLFDMKMLSEFQKAVITTMEEVLTKDQQQEFKNKIKSKASGGK